MKRFFLDEKKDKVEREYPGYRKRKNKAYANEILHILQKTGGAVRFLQFVRRHLREPILCGSGPVPFGGGLLLLPDRMGRRGSLDGRIIAEADRQIEPETIVRRTVQYGFAHYPELDREGHWQRTLEHLHVKYAEGGYLKLWIPESPNAAKLAALRALIADEAQLRILFDKFFDAEN